MEVVDVASEVWSQLGPGFSERIYHNAMEVGLRKKGIDYQSEVIIPVRYMDHNVGNVRADLIVNNVIVELKSIAQIKPCSEIQARMYCKLLGLKEYIVFNFPPTDGDMQYLIKQLE
jgi:GxxExxY protein